MPAISMRAGASKRSLLLVAAASLTMLAATTATAHGARAAVPPAPANTAVITQKYNTSRNGWNPNETILNTGNVNASGFGRLISYPVDGQVYAQPLFVPGVTTSTGQFNLVIVATEHDSLYAFDADRTQTTPVWHTTFLTNGATSVPTAVVYPGGFQDISPEIGITGTPVIDITSRTLYVSVMTMDGGTTPVHRLHAIDITTGLDKITPVVITATAAGKGDGNVNNVITFHSQTENQRMGLLLLNGKVYVSYAGYADQYPYHGWILGYDAATLQQTDVFNVTANGGGGGLWDDGNGFVVDPSDSSIYVQSGNGAFDATLTPPVDMGMSLMRLSTTNGLHVMDYFTPFNYDCLNSLDRDLGSGGAILLPTQTGAHPNDILGGGKEGRIYVLDRTNLGKYTPLVNDCTQQNLLNVDNVVQEMPLGAAIGNSAIYTTPSLWQGPGGTTVFEAGNGDFIKAFSLNNGLLSAAPTSKTPETFNFPGVNTTVSSNGGKAGTGILWGITPNGSCPVLDHCNPGGAGVLRAYDASNLGTELYSTTMNPTRDALSSFVKFTVPVVANGEVFVGTGNSLDIFGLNPPAPTPTPTGTLTPTTTVTPTPTPIPPSVAYNNVGVSDDAAPSAGNFDGVNSYSAEALQSVHVIPGAAIPVNNAQLVWPNAPAGSANNWRAVGQVIPVTPVAGAQTLSFLGAANGGTSSGTATITYTDGSTQTFTLTFSDWTLSGGGGALASADTTVLTTAYRNTPSGKQTVATYVFYTDIALQAGKTIKSVTLPTAVTQGALHVFSLATTASAALTGQLTTPPPTVLSPYNSIGITNDSAPSKGNYDGSHSYSAQALAAAGVSPGSIIIHNGVTFTWPNVASGVVDNWKAKGQVISVTPVANAQVLGFLGSATSGPSAAVVTLTFTDGTTQVVTLTFSDWTLNGGSKQPVAGNQIAITTAYRNSSTTQQQVKTYVFYTGVTLPAGKTLKSVTLPATVSQGTFHIFSVGTAGPPPATASYNSVGVTEDANVLLGNYDGLNSYSLQALSAVGVTPGSTTTVSGVSFTWPNVAAGQLDNYQANGQTVDYTSVAGATTLAFLGSATSGSASGPALIRYTDGSTQAFILGFSDWTLGAGSQTILAGNQIAVTTAYRNTQTGKDATATYVFYTEVALQSGKTVAGITLPSTTTQGVLHVFAIGSKA